MKKKYRQQIIKKIIQTHKISSQQELAEILNQEGVVATQATLSRDLAELNILKIPDDKKGHVYILPEQFLKHNPDLSPRKFPVNSIQSLGFSGNLAVIKCTPSFAPTIALIMDDLGIDQILGTIAGDDTVLVILNENTSQREFKKELCRIIPELTNRI